MNQTFANLRALFEHCIDLPEGERMQWIEDHVSDTALRIEVQLMLAADDHAEGFLARDVVAHISDISDIGVESAAEFRPEHLIGRCFGTFELVRLIGQGGQGAVYLARRIGSDFEQTAAVKLLRRGFHDAEEHRRFRREREILARFEHSGVARLIDGGVSPDGVPYLAMEYVDGLPIDRWCFESALSRDARLELFARLCDVVSAAQRALIVHRDLKPSNVLVTMQGDIKVLDFGIARLLDDDDPRMQTLVPMMTPGYGAPEQASGGAITLATDVHALGVLLRVLLTDESPSTTERVLQPTLSTKLAPELRWIIGKATLAEPELRYGDAAQLAEDIRRFVESRPVLAHPPSRWYRSSKFVARHRGGVVLTSVFAISIIASLGLALWQGKIARDQARRAESARDFLLGVFEAAKEDLPRAARPTPEVLVRAASKRLDNDRSLAPSMRAEFFSVLSTISESGNDYPQAIELADRALAILESNNQGDSRQALAIEIKRANIQVSIGEAERAERADQALGLRMEAIRAVDDEIAIEGLLAYARTRGASGHVDAGIEQARLADDLASRLFGPGSASATLASLLHGDVLALAGYNQQAVQVLEPALRARKSGGLPPDHHVADSLQNLSTAKYHLGDMVGSESALRDALELSRQIHDAPHEKIADALFSLGTHLMDADRADEAEGVMLEAASMYAALFNPAHAQNVGMLDGLGSLEMQRRRYEPAVHYFERATTLCAEPSMHDNPDCGRYWQNLSHAYLRLQRSDAALAANREGLELRRRLLGEKHPAFAGSLAGRAAVLLTQGKANEALGSIDQALAIFIAANQGNSLGAAFMRRTRSAALSELHRYAEALQMLDEADALARRIEPDDAEYTLGALGLRADILAATGRSDDAREVARSAMRLESRRALLTAGKWNRLKALAN